MKKAGHGDRLIRVRGMVHAGVGSTGGRRYFLIAAEWLAGGISVAQIHGNNRYRELGHEVIHALQLEEAAKVVLSEAKLAPADRAVLEKAVWIARTLQKSPSLEE
jgi:hypothetical protein